MFGLSLDVVKPHIIWNYLISGSWECFISSLKNYKSSLVGSLSMVA